MIKVGFVTTPLSSAHSVRGVGKYTKHLLSRLKSQAPNFGIDLLEIENYLKIENCKLEIIHYPFFDLFRPTFKIFPGIKTVVTIHDCIPLQFPAHYPPGAKGWINFQIQKQVLNQVDRVITDSYASVQTVHKYLQVPNEKIKLVYLAADPIFKKNPKPKNKFNLPKKFVLYVGDINYNKNIPALIAGCEIAGLPLVIVGKQAGEIEKLDLTHPELSHLEGVDFSKVIRLGFVSDSDLVDIYNLASVYCMPSLAEGSALSILEALSCTTPVACSDIPVFHEHADNSAVYFDPKSLDDMARAIQAAKSQKRSPRTSKFSWDQTASETLNVYQEIT